jgi:two-component system phosphate regulon sensor histidine kinase PhoR
LESLRKDFVANVSHELKTPLTSIKGFVEMLFDSDMSDPDSAKEFLKIILRQTDRLNEIIEDLLALSKIERDAENDRVNIYPTPQKIVQAIDIDLCA